jgi:hypothetical protein
MQPSLTPRDRLIQDQLLSKYALSESIINMTSSSLLFAASADPSPSDASFATTTTTTSRLKTKSGVIKTSGTIASSSSLDDALTLSSRGATKSSIETAKSSPSRSSQVKTLTTKINVNHVEDMSKVVTSTSKFNISPIQQQKKTQQTTTTSSSLSAAQSSTREVSSGPSPKTNLYLKPTIGSLNRSTTIPPKATRSSVLVKRAAHVSPPSLPVVISAVPIRSRYAQRARDLPKTTTQPSSNPVSSSSLLNEGGIQERNNNNNAVSNTIADVAPTGAVFDLNGDTSFSLSPSATLVNAGGLTSSSVKGKGLHLSSKALKQVRGPINTRGSSSQSKTSSPIVIASAAAAASVPTSTNLASAPDVSQSLSSLSQQQQQQQHYPSSINNDNNRSSLVFAQGEEEEEVGQEEDEQHQEERNSFLDRTGVIIRNEELQRTLDAVDSAVMEAAAAVSESLRLR